MNKKYLSIFGIHIIILINILCMLTGCKKERFEHVISSWDTIFFQDSSIYPSKIRFWDNNTGYVFANRHGTSIPKDERHLVLYTNDGGNNWATYYTSIGCRCFVLLDKNTLVGISDKIYKSTDCGRTWDTLISIQANVNCIYIKDKTHWIFGYGSSIYTTADGGYSISKVCSLDTLQMLHPDFDQLTFPVENIGYASGGMSFDMTNFGLIVKTTDGGKSWALLDPDISLPDIRVLQFISEKTGYIFSTCGALYKTTDGGSSWIYLDSTYCAGNGHFYSEKRGYYSDGPVIFKTSDGGNSWVVDYGVSDDKNDIIDMYFDKSGRIYAATRYGYILRKNNLY